VSMIKWRELPFTRAIKDGTSKANKVNQDRFQTSGEYPIVDQGSDFIAGYIDDESLVWKGDLPVIIFGDHTRTLKYVDFPFVLGADGAKVLQPIPDLWPQFAYFALLELDIPSAGYSRHFKFLKETLIRFPPLPEQKRIADILAKADRLRRLRRTARDLSDTYLQSVFLEMFGDCLKDHPSTPLGELVTITGGGTPSRKIDRYYRGDIPWLTSKDMRGDYIYDTQEHVTEEAIEESAAKLVPADSILVVVKSKVLMHRLPVAVAKRPLCHGQDVKSIQCSEKIEPLFLIYVLKHNEPRLLSRARGANTEGLTLPMLREVPVPDVSLTLQRNFARIVHQFEQLRARQREAQRQAEHLFQTLLHRAFRGAL
jgi:type I restriction enzyme S subunit